MKFKKTALIMAGVTALTSLTGCGGKKASDNSEKVTVNWIMPGPGMQKDSEEVFKALNEKIKTYEGFENVELNITPIVANDYAQKFLLMQTSGNAMDIVQTYCLEYVDEVRNGSFLPLDDYIEKSDKFKDAFPDWFWDYALVDGKHYYVPNYQVMSNVDYSFATQKKLSDKYSEFGKLEETFQKAETFDNSCWDAVESYLDALNAGGDIKMGYSPLDSLTFTLQKGYEDVGNRFYIKMDDPEHKLVYMDEMPERINSFKRVAALFQKGYIRKDIASIGDTDTAMGNEDGYSLWHTGTRMQKDLNEFSISGTEKKFGFEIDVAKTKDYDYIPSSNAAGGNAISVSSKNPDIAWKVIELFNTKEGKDIYNMMVFGLEDKHYKKVSDNIIEPVDYVSQASSSSSYGMFRWVVGNTKYSYYTPTEPMTEELFDDANNGEHSLRSSLTGFILNSDGLETEIAQINAVFEEYKNLNRGTYSDIDKVYSEYMNKVKTAGLEKVRESYQKQVDEFFADKK